MADLSDGVNWSETDASNNKASPLGWPEGMMPSGVNDSARADKGALKRFWDRINPVQTITPASGLYTFVTANPTYPAGYINGEIYEFNAAAASVGGDTFQVNALGAKPIQRRIAPGPWGPIAAQDITAAFPVRLCYNSTLNGGAGAFILLNPYVPASGDGTGGIVFSGEISAPEVRITAPASPYFSLYQNAGIFGIAHQTNGGRLTLDATGKLSVVGGIFGADLHATGNAYLGGSTLFFSGNLTTAAGPFLQVASVFVARLGAAVGSFNFVRADNTLAVQFADDGGISAGPRLNLSGTTSTVNLAGSNGVFGPYINADSGSINQRLGSGNVQYNWRDSSGTALMTLTSAGNLTMFADITAGGALHAAGDIYINGQGLHFVGSTTLGPYLQANNAGWTARAGSGNGLFQFADAANAVQLTINFANGQLTAQNTITSQGANAGFTWYDRSNNTLAWTLYTSAGAARIYGNGADRLTMDGNGNTSITGTFAAANDIYAPLLRGGNGQDAGVLRGMPTADPTRHTVAFGWDQNASVFYKITDNSRTDTLIWSDAIRAMLLVTDGGSPSGWKLQAFSGASIFNIYVTNTTSDARLKRGIGDSKIDALAAICAVPVRRFEWRKEAQATFGVPQKPVEIGLVAQDLLPHMPDCVGISEGGEKPYPADTHTLMHDRIEAYLFRAVQQLGTRIAQLEAK